MPAGSEQAFDVVQVRSFWKTETGGFAWAPIHVAVVAAPGVFVHSAPHTDSALGHYRRDPALVKAIAGFWRYVG